MELEKRTCFLHSEILLTVVADNQKFVNKISFASINIFAKNSEGVTASVALSRVVRHKVS